MQSILRFQLCKFTLINQCSIAIAKCMRQDHGPHGASVKRLIALILQLASWMALKAYVDFFSQTGFGPIPRSVVANTLAPLEADPSKPWTPCAAMLRAAMGLPKTGPSISKELDSFVNDLSSWVNSSSLLIKCLRCKVLSSDDVGKCGGSLPK